MKFNTRKIFACTFVSVMAALLMFLAACGGQPAAGHDEPAAETAVEHDWEDIGLDGLDLVWVDPGIDYASLRFEYAGEGLYLLEAVIADGFSKFGFMDKTGTIVIPVAFDHANAFTDGLAYVEADGRGFFIDPSGAEALSLGEFITGTPFEFGFSRISQVVMHEVEGGVTMSHYRGLIDTAGNVVIPAEFEEAGAFENGVLWTRQNWHYALFDNLGNQLTPHEFNEIAYAGEGLILALRDGRYGHLDRNGNTVTPFEYDMVGSFSDGLAFVVLDGLAGYVNTQGEVAIPIQFGAAEAFNEERAAVLLPGEMFGFIDTQGNAVTPGIYDEIWSFENGAAVAIALIGRGATMVTTLDRYGEVILEPENVGFFRWRDMRIAYNNPAHGFAGVNFNVMALLDYDGNQLTGFNFSDIFEFYEGLAVAQVPGEYALFYGLINQYGAEIIPAVMGGITILDRNTAIIQSDEVAADTGAARSRVGIVTLPDDAATRQAAFTEWDAAAGAYPIME